MPDVPSPARASRRTFLRLAVLAPAAASCATSQPRPSALPTAAGGAAPADRAGGAAGVGLAAIRAYPLPGGSEPACSFRALAPGEDR
jgi:hypothetical protein